MWDRAWLDVRHTFWDLDGFEMGPGWSWDTNVGNLMEVICHLEGGEMQISGHGLRWNTTLVDGLVGGETGHWHRCALHLQTWMEVRRDLDWGDTWISGPEWSWEAAWREVWCVYIDLDWVETVHVGETKIFGPGSRWDRTWMEVRHISWDLDEFEIGHGWNWDEILGTWMELRHHLGGGESQISGHGLRWDTAWI